MAGRAHRDIVEERLASHAALAEERWETHRESHYQLAQALSEYKASANEWRATLSDVRSAGVGRSEYAAEHKMLRTELESLIHTLDVRIGLVERMAQTSIDREKTARDLFGSIRSLILLGFVVMGGLITLVLYFERVP